MESKVAQFILNYVMTERLREYLLERVATRGKISLEIPLGEDALGNLVVMSVNVAKISQEARKMQNIPGGVPEPEREEGGSP